MPIPIPDGGIIQVTFRGVVLNQEMITVLHYVLDAPGGIPDAFLAMDAVKTQIVMGGGLWDKYRAALSQNYSQGRIRLQWLIPDRLAYREYVPPNTDGAQPSDCPGPNVSVAVNKRSEVAGVHGRGVTHMPAVPIDFLLAGEVNVAGLLAYADVGTQMKTDLVTLGSGTYHPIIFNRATPGDIVQVTAFTVDNKVRTMHRRTVGLGS